MHQTNRIKKSIHPLYCFLALLLLLSLCGCGKKIYAQTESNPAGRDDAESTEADDRIFRGMPINPEGPIVDPQIRPYVDPDGAFIIAALEGKGDDGTYGTVRMVRSPDNEIVTEELSALTAKHITPEECAERLQSRVSIWLAEHR